jgi:hypothetical protein
MSDFKKADFDALLRAFFDSRPMTQEETDAAKAAIDKMSDWQSMSIDELNRIIKDEEQARSSGDK